ncbi:MAG: 50S ribosomal protein L29 [Chloroflexota bacterium]
MIDISDARGFNDTDLAERLDSAKQELMKLREKYATRQLTDTSQMRQVRHDIARLMSVRRERQLAKAQEITQ